MEMKANFCVFSIISTIIILAINPTSFAYAQVLEKYEDVLNGFKFQYPKEWKGIFTNNYANTGVVFNLSPLIGKDELLNNNIYVYQDFPISITQKQFVRDHILERVPYNIRESVKLNETEFAGIPSIKATWNSSVSDKVEKITIMYSVIKDNTAYVIKYEAEPSLFEKWLPQVNALVKSFQIT